MGYELKLIGSEQGDHITDLCTNGGWSELCKWMASLPSEYPVVKEFSGRGRTSDTVTLAIQLNRAIEAHLPEDPDVAHTANRLADLLGAGAEHETAMVS